MRKVLVFAVAGAALTIGGTTAALASSSHPEHGRRRPAVHGLDDVGNAHAQRGFGDGHGAGVIGDLGAGRDVRSEHVPVGGPARRPHDRAR